MNSWQKAIKYAAIAFAIFLTVAIIGGIVGTVASLGFIFGDDEVTGERESYGVTGQIRELDIDISAAQFEFKVGDSFNVETDLSRVTVEEKGDRLVITEKSRLFGVSDKAMLTVTVPAGTVFDKADISSGAGTVTIDELSAESIHLKLGAGEVKIGAIYASERAEINGGAGKVTISGGEMNRLDFDMGVGEVSVTSKLTGECNLDCDVGKTELNLVGGEEDYRIEVDKGIGDVSVGGMSVGDGTVIGSGRNEIEIDCGIGGVEVKYVIESSRRD